MSLVTKTQLNIVLQSIKGLLSTKLDHSDIATGADAIALLAELKYVDPVASADNSIYTNSRGEVYTL